VLQPDIDFDKAVLFSDHLGVVPYSGACVSVFYISADGISNSLDLTRSISLRGIYEDLDREYTVGIQYLDQGA
jgi:hypothetical protein